ncbi:IS1 family transposase [Rhizobium ruizarguesonis]
MAILSRRSALNLCGIVEIQIRRLKTTAQYQSPGDPRNNAAEAALTTFEGGFWGRKFPAVVQIWRRAWQEGGRKHWLWRAVDQDGYVLDEIVQARRDSQAARRLLVRLLKKQGLTPKRIVTDKLRSYGAARREVMAAVEHRSHKGLNNRAENSHLPLRKRDQMMQGFRSVSGLQRFISIFSARRNLFVPRHHALIRP